jgi:hypothetical protein
MTGRNFPDIAAVHEFPVGTFRKCRTVRAESAVRTKPDAKC